MRGTRTQRGYDNDWLRYSKARLALHPWCVYCLREGKRDKDAMGTLTDHIIPPNSNPALYWELFMDQANHQTLCVMHHGIKTIEDDGGFGNKRKSHPC